MDINIIKGISIIAVSMMIVPLNADTLRDRLSGNLSLEARHFLHDGLQSEQTDGGFSISIEPEFKQSWNDGKTVFTFTPFYRRDNNDDSRTHGDIRQLDVVHVKGDWEFQVGISKVFWGVTESQHLVDVINQTDALEGFDGEDKLGQPMVRVSRLLEEGDANLELFVLPYFRERKYGDIESRFKVPESTPLPIDDSNAQYESGKKERHVDLAVRYTKTIDEFDVGLSYFQGTSREASNLEVNLTNTALNPYYPQMKQAGLDLQYTGESIIWKLEAIHRDTNFDNYRAAVGGFEYTIPGVTEAGADLGLLAEYHHDSRGEVAAASFQNDIFAGARLALNDEASTEVLAGVFYDLDNQAQSYRIEASRRLGKGFKINAEAQWFTHTDSQNPLHALRQDDYIQLELQKFF